MHYSTLSFFFECCLFLSTSVLNRVLFCHDKVTLAPWASNLNFWLSNRHKQIINDVYKMDSLIFIKLCSFYLFFIILVVYENFLQDLKFSVSVMQAVFQKSCFHRCLKLTFQKIFFQITYLLVSKTFLVILVFELPIHPAVFQGNLIKLS